MTLPFSLPPPQGATEGPIWTGAGFRLSGQIVPVLEYSENLAGWSDDLTMLHEQVIGDSHPIDIASREDALGQLKANLGGKTNPVVLEVGCSSGFMLKAMATAFPSAVIVGADVVQMPLLNLARELPTVPLMRFDLLRCPLPSHTFDAVVMLNVLEHIDDDLTALKQAYRMLKPGGFAVIEVPAGPHLYDAYDKALRHFRRYKLSELTEKMRQAGFSIQRKSYLGFFIYPAFAFVKYRNQKYFGSTGNLAEVVKEQALHTSSHWLMKTAIAIETFLGRWLLYPIGIRCLVVGHK